MAGERVLESPHCGCSLPAMPTVPRIGKEDGMPYRMINLIGVVVLSCLTLGCPGRIVELQTEPPGATVSVTRLTRSGQSQSFSLPALTPVRYEFDFVRAPNIETTFRKERYLDETVNLTREFLDSLPIQQGVRVLRVPLVVSPFREVEKAEVEVDPDKGLTVSFRRVRAFKEDIEREGVPASRVLQLEEGAWVGGLSASPTEDRLAFSVVEKVQDDTGTVLEFSTVRALGGAGGGITQLTTGRWLDTDPCFSHDGENLYFASDRLRGGYLDLFRIYSRAKGGGIAAIHSGEGWCRTPSSGKGGLLAFGFRPEYSGELSATHVWTLGGANQYPTQLGEGADPEVSPDGREIVYIGPNGKLWKISLETSTVVQLTTDANTMESDPTWSRDGSHIIFVSDKGLDGTGQPNNDIWMMRANGTDVRQLTTNGSDDVNPVVSHDQAWIYFVSNRGYKWGIWRIPWASGASAGVGPGTPD